MKTLFKYTLIGLLAFNLSCEEKKDECAACQSALNHMNSKLKANACNPNYMQNAWDKIKEDCNTRSSYAVGYMAENCSFNYNGSISCTKIASGIQFYDDGKRPIAVRYTNGLPNDTLLVILSEKQDLSYPNTITIAANQYPTIEYTGYNEAYAKVYIAVLKLPLMDTVATETATFQYNRTNNWHKMREVKVTYSPNFQGYLVSLENW